MSSLNFRRAVALVFAFFATCAFAQQSLVGVNYFGSAVRSTGVQISANYGSACPQKGVSAQIYSIGSTADYQGQCFLNAAWDTVLGTPTNSLSSTINQGYCHMRIPIDQLSPNQILLRLWKVTADCTKYAYEDNQTQASAYQDYLLSDFSAAEWYYPKTTNSLVTVSKPTYAFKLDRNGGAFYEFYNLRATLGGNSFFNNAIHPHSGEALQIALRTDTVFMTNPCGNQGFFNPTQTGNTCSHNGTTASGYNTGSGPTVTFVKCDGTLNNSCSSASSSIEIGEHAMRSFDYGANYPGPLNPGDVVKLSQVVTPSNNYVEVDLTVKNTGATTLTNAAIEIPTFYFKPDFRRYTVRRAGAIYQHDIPDKTGTASLTVSQLGIDEGASDFRHEDVSWISFENVRGYSNDVYTIAWFYKNNFRADVATFAGNYAYQILESAYFRSIKFNNNPRFNMRPSSEKVYTFKYVVFPYRYDEVISSPYGTMSVENVILNMKAAYEN
ncbi:MAG: hypothetical protein HYX47_08420 [Burkholderiales bacterium]|nr:hypothetical protein [Burkholderiales bacterium]